MQVSAQAHKSLESTQRSEWTVRRSRRGRGRVGVYSVVGRGRSARGQSSVQSLWVIAAEDTNFDTLVVGGTTALRFSTRRVGYRNKVGRCLRVMKIKEAK